MRSRKPVLSYDLRTGVIVQFESCVAAARAGYDRRNVHRCDRGRQRTYRGKRWMYLTR